MSEIEKYYNGEIHIDFEEIPIELYRKTNNEFVKYVRYDDYKKLENIIKEVREWSKKLKYETLWQTTREELEEILDKEKE